MRRKQISFDVFERMEESSLNRIEDELRLAAPLLSEALEVPTLRLRSFGASTVLFESIDGTYVSGTYSYDDEHISVDNLEVLVINEEEERLAARDLIRGFLSNLQAGNKDAANEAIDSYLSLPRIRKVYKSEDKPLAESIRDSRWSVRRRSNDVMFSKNVRESIATKAAGWSAVAENVVDALDSEKLAPSLKSAKVKRDDRGNVVCVKMGDKKTRNESLFIQRNRRAIGREILEGWAAADRLDENDAFVRAIAKLKRANYNSDDDGLQETLDNIVVRFPELLYMTEGELSTLLKESLISAGIEQFSDEDCEFMSEAILRTMHGVHADRVSRVLYAANATVSEGEDAYEAFKDVVGAFYPQIAEHAAEEIRMYADLYESIREVREVAISDGHRGVVARTAEHLDALMPIIRFESAADAEVAEAAAEFLHMIAESNAPRSEEENLHRLELPKNKGMNPADDVWGTAAASDGKRFKAGGSAKGLANDKGETYPSLSNPYLPKSVKKKVPDSAEDGGNADTKGSDVYPQLKNPYLPKSVQRKVKDSPEDGGLANMNSY